MATTASADTIVGVATPAALSPNDAFHWSQLGFDQTILAANFAVHSDLLHPGNVSLAGGAGSIVSVECPAGACSWPAGNFGAGESLIWTSTAGNASTGPLALDMSDYVSGAGAYIQLSAPGSFTARISAYNGLVLIGSYSVASDLAGDVVFLGLADLTGANINRLVFDMTACGGDFCDLNSFALDTVLTNDAVPTPEPASLALLGSGLVGLGGTLRRRFAKA